MSLYRLKLRKNMKLKASLKGDIEMLYFSDLDRTLIYSSKIANFSINNVCIEKLKGKDISYISKKSIRNIEKLLKFMTIIPVTTRTIEQYRRIEFAHHNINFQWAIVSNGSYILKNNEPIKEWDNHIKQIKNQSEDLLKVFEKFSLYKNINGLVKTKIAEDNFFYCIIDKTNFQFDDLERFIYYLKESNWNYYLNGRKLYFMPKGMTKENAINFLLKSFKESSFIASGDSILDLNMLNLSNVAYIPKHADILHNVANNKIFISKNEGILATEEILEEIINTNREIV